MDVACAVKECEGRCRWGMYCCTQQVAIHTLLYMCSRIPCSYLDLGAGVIILLCGGTMAMNGQHVTVGALITFQLYWGRMQNAIKGLNDIMMSFTRAAGAAQRVLSLVGTTPDISASLLLLSLLSHTTFPFHTCLLPCPRDLLSSIPSCSSCRPFVSS